MGGGKKGVSSLGPARAQSVPGSRAEGANECTAAMASQYRAMVVRARLYDIPPRKVKDRAGVFPAGTKTTTTESTITYPLIQVCRLSNLPTQERERKVALPEIPW